MDLSRKIVLQASLLASIFTVGCSSRPAIEGFNTSEWLSAPVCSKARMDLAIRIEQQDDKLFGLTQPDIEKILGVAPRHELFGRNEKFFYYPLTKDCNNSASDQSLFIRFDALGRAKEVLIVQD